MCDVGCRSQNYFRMTRLLTRWRRTSAQLGFSPSTGTAGPANPPWRSHTKRCFGAGRDLSTGSKKTASCCSRLRRCRSPRTNGIAPDAKRPTSTAVGASTTRPSCTAQHRNGFANSIEHSTRRRRLKLATTRRPRLDAWCAFGGLWAQWLLLSCSRWSPVRLRFNSPAVPASGRPKPSWPRWLARRLPKWGRTRTLPSFSRSKRIDAIRRSRTSRRYSPRLDRAPWQTASQRSSRSTIRSVATRRCTGMVRPSTGWPTGGWFRAQPKPARSSIMDRRPRHVFGGWATPNSTSESRWQVTVKWCGLGRWTDHGRSSDPSIAQWFWPVDR